MRQKNIEKQKNKQQLQFKKEVRGTKEGFRLQKKKNPDIV